MKFEKYLTPEQQKTLEAQEKAEEEKRIRERGDNQTVRALDNMMGGVLEIRKEDELKKVTTFIQCVQLVLLCLASSFFLMIQ